MTSSGMRRITKLLGPAIAVKHLVSVMRQTGDSWEATATTGDTQLWVPGGPKQESQNLGVDFPGKAARRQPTDR